MLPENSSQSVQVFSIPDPEIGFFFITFNGSSDVGRARHLKNLVRKNLEGKKEKEIGKLLTMLNAHIKL